MRIKRLLQFLRIILILPGVNWSNDEFMKDLLRWKKIIGIESSDYQALAQIMWEYPEFRNLFIYRNRYRRIYRTWVELWYPPMNTLFLQAKEIGGGLYIQHGFSTMVSAESIGENCWINQQVTIGFKDNSKAPVIGNNVMITCGAKVLGNITIGDNVTIGANAVVVHDVEDNSVMGGIPARKIK